MFHKILVAVDFSEASRRALRAAISLAKACLATVEALHVDVGRFPSFTAHGTGALAELNQKFETFFPPEMYPRSRKQVLIGNSVSREILNQARILDCDLVVMGSHGHSPIEQIVLGSVTQYVTRNSETPVLVVHDFPAEQTNYDRVLVPTDFSEPAIHALQYAVRFAAFLKAELHFVHVVDLPALEEIHSRYLIERIQLPNTCELNVDSILKKSLEATGFDGKTLTATLSGDPVKEILKYTESNSIDWIVMGTHGRKGLERLLLGSVTAGVVSRSKAPVLTLSNLSIS